MKKMSRFNYMLNLSKIYVNNIFVIELYIEIVESYIFSRLFEKSLM